MKRIFIACALSLVVFSNGWAEEAADIQPASEPLNYQELEQYVNSYDYKKLLADERITPYLDLLNHKQQKTFSQNFAVWSPIGFEGGFLVLSACRQHACDEHSALLLVHTRSGELTGYIYGDKTYQVFSTNDYQKLAGETKLDWRTHLPIAMQKQMLWNGRDMSKAVVIENIERLEK